MPAEPSGMDRGTHTHEQKLSSRDSDSDPHPQLGPRHQSSPTMRVPKGIHSREFGKQRAKRTRGRPRVPHLLSGAGGRLFPLSGKGVMLRVEMLGYALRASPLCAVRRASMALAAAASAKDALARVPCCLQATGREVWLQPAALCMGSGIMLGRRGRAAGAGSSWCVRGLAAGGGGKRSGGGRKKRAAEAGEGPAGEGGQDAREIDGELAVRAEVLRAVREGNVDEVKLLCVPLKIDELKAVLRELGGPTTGSRALLLERILCHILGYASSAQRINVDPREALGTGGGRQPVRRRACMC